MTDWDQKDRWETYTMHFRRMWTERDGEDTRKSLRLLIKMLRRVKEGMK